MENNLAATIDAMSLAYWGRETCQHDHDAVARFGMPKYGCGTKLALGSNAGSGYAGHQFEVEGMFWSDLLHSWVYYVPTFDFYQCESDLEEII